MPGPVVLKPGPGVFHSVTINKLGAKSTVVTVFDNTTAAGAIIGVVDTSFAVVTLEYDIAFQVGLTVSVDALSTADMTFAFL